MSHANAWILNNLSNKDRCEQLLSGFAESWWYVNGHLAGLCRRRIILDLFGEKDTPATAQGDCCDVCKSTSNVSDHKLELKVLINALEEVGCKGEVKVAEWIRGSNISWTNAHNKQWKSLWKRY